MERNPGARPAAMAGEEVREGKYVLTNAGSFCFSMTIPSFRCFPLPLQNAPVIVFKDSDVITAKYDNLVTIAAIFKMNNLTKLSLLVVLFIGGIACKKDEKDNQNNNPTTSEKIEGEWKMTYHQDTLGSVNSQGQDPAYIMYAGQSFTGTLMFGADKQITSSVVINNKVTSDARGSQPDTIYDQETDYMDGWSWSVTPGDTLQLVLPNGGEKPMYIKQLDDQHLELVWTNIWSSAGYQMTHIHTLKFEK